MKKKLKRVLAAVTAIVLAFSGMGFSSAVFAADAEGLFEDAGGIDVGGIFDDSIPETTAQEALLPEQDNADEDLNAADIEVVQAATPGDYSFTEDWTVWSQSGFGAPKLKSDGCRMIAYSKMLVQTGAVPMSAVKNGTFNPGIFYDWCASNGWISGMIDEVGKPAGQCPGDFAKKVYGTDLSVAKIEIEGWNDGQKKDKIMELINAGYTVILGCTQHFVCVDTAATKSNNYPYIQESYSDGPGQTVKVESGNFTLSTYTNLRYWSCSGSPTPGPVTPTPVPEGEYSGKCGDNLTWTLKDQGQNHGLLLTISGTGDMYDYEGYHATPWYQKAAELQNYRFEDIVIQNGITKIGAYAFCYVYKGSGFYKIDIPETVTEIGAYAFNSCSIGGQLVIPDSVKSIGKGAFSSTQISSVSFGKGITEIPDNCFSSCANLTGDIVIPDKVIRIGESAFSFWNPEEIIERKVILPDTLEEIGDSAFRDNTGLTSVTPLLPSSLKSLGDSAFEGCSNLQGTLTIPENIYVEYYAFRNCSSLTGTLTIPRGMYYMYNGDTNRPKGSVSPCCFEGCTGFTSLIIEEGMEDLGDKAFYNCTGLTGELVIPSGCYIEDETFKNCSSINKLTIPRRCAGGDKVMIRQGSFENCSGLTGTLTLDQNDVSSAIGDMNRAFWGTNYNIIRLEGDCSGGILEWDLVGKNERGKYKPEWGEEIEDADLATFPKDAIIYYEDKFFIAERGADGKPGWAETETIKVLDELGYTYKSFSEAGIKSPDYYIVDVTAYAQTVYLNSKDGGSIYKPYNPSNVDDADKVKITIEDESIATLEQPAGSKGVRWNIIPHKVGKTKYTVSVNTHDYGLQTATGTITVLADANTRVCTATFILNGGECSDLGYWSDKAADVTKSDDSITASFVSGTTDIKKLPVPVHEGYKFGGWYSDTTFKKAVKSISKKTANDLTLYAKWIAPYRVIMHDGTAEKIYKGFTVNKAKALAACPFKRTDAAFTGWSITKDSNVITYLNKEKLTEPGLVVEDGILTLHLYAVWQSDFTITADMGGGDYGAKEKNRMPTAYTYAEVYKKAITLPKIMVRDGYKFGGWFDSVTGKKITSISKTTCRDYVLHSKWTPLTYQVVYKANAPKGSKVTGKMSTQKITVGTEAENRLRANKFVLKGYRFVGWSLEAGSEEVAFTDNAQFGFGEGGYTKKVTLYAVWQEE